MYQKMIEYVEDYLAGTDITATNLKKRFPFRNRFHHTLRVIEWAKRINQVERGDEEIVMAAAIFHDIGKAAKELPHAEASAEICEEYLQGIGFEQEKISRIKKVIEVHSKKKAPKEELFLEQRIIIDADMLDEVGMLVVLWDSMDAGTEKVPSYYKVYDRIYSRYLERKNELAYCKTEAGKRLYRERLVCLANFLQELKYELAI